MMSNHSHEIENATPVTIVQVLFFGTLAIIAATLLSVMLLPQWLPGLAVSLVGDAPQVFWYLSRGSALVSFGLLWVSMVLGLVITNRMARIWHGGPTALDLHQYVSLLGLGFGIFHALNLIGDHNIQFTLFQILVPFSSHAYKPFWVGLGQIAFYAWALLVGSYYVRKQIGGRTWRQIHYLSFVTFALLIVHGIVSGTDSSTIWASIMDWTAGGSLLFLLYYRIIATTKSRHRKSNVSIET